jgi:hypothetical protein
MSDCFCDYDPPAFCRIKVVQARKEHKCRECYRTIKVGETYETASGMWDGSLGRFKTCSHCLEIRRFVENSVPCFCWAHGNVLYDARDAIADAYIRAKDEVKGLAFGYGRLVIAGRRAQKGLPR